VRRISAANFLEAAVVVDRNEDPVVSLRFDDLIPQAEIVIEPVTERQVHWLEPLTGTSEKALDILQVLISEIALPMPWQRTKANLFYTKAAISFTPI